MRIGLVVAAFVLLVGAPSPRPTPPNQKTPNAAEEQPKPNKQPTNSSPVRAQENSTQNSANHNSASVTANPNVQAVRVMSLPPRSAGDIVALLCTIILTIIGATGIIAAFQTITAIKKQSDAMVKSARAWVMVDLEKTPGKGSLFESTSQSGNGPEHHSVHFNVRCICSNQGQTAARIVEKRCAMVVVGGDDELPDSPNLAIDIQDPVPHYLKANGEPWHDDWTVGIEGVKFPTEGKLFVIYGVVRYVHLFSDQTVQTTFAYTLRFDRKLERLISKPKYNQNS